VGKADLHLHTRLSDGFPTVERLLEYVEHETDLDVIAVTDHEDVAGGQRARELAAKRGYRFEVIAGAEITSFHGHVLALFVEETPPVYRSIERTLEAIHAQGGIAIAPHPFGWLTRSLSERTIGRLQRRAEAGITLDAIELANPSPAGTITRKRALRRNREWRLPATGSSDAHHLLQVGKGWTEFEGTTAADLRRAIAGGATAARMTRYPSLREVGIGNTALGLAWGYAATPRKVMRMALDRRGRQR
jgi:predicted metal-dependent phosphoesterase TrpH